MTETISWVATVATIIAASMTAANLGSRITGYGFVVFTFGALCWIAVGALTGQPALLWTNVVLTVLDLFGIWRWLGRQSKVEEGGRAASDASESTPGEALFPVSLLSRASVMSGRTELAAALMRWPAVRAVGSIMSSSRKAGLPGSGRLCAGCRGTAPASTVKRCIAGSARPTSPNWKSCRGTNGRGADRHRRDRRRGLRLARSPAPGPFPARAQPARRASDDLPCLAAIVGRRGRAALARCAPVPPRALDRRADGPWRGRRLSRVSRISIASATSSPTDFHGLLSAQDQGGWRPHVTIQNKVAAEDGARFAGRP